MTPKLSEQKPGGVILLVIVVLVGTIVLTTVGGTGALIALPAIFVAVAKLVAILK